MSNESHTPAKNRPVPRAEPAPFEPIVPDHLERYLKRLDAEMAPAPKSQKGG